jgi:hypothetical protein
VAFFEPPNHGVRFVANSVVTSRKMLGQQPQTVKRFTRALLAGWQAARQPAKEDAVVNAEARCDRNTEKAVIHRQLVVTRRMIQPDSSCHSPQKIFAFVSSHIGSYFEFGKSKPVFSFFHCLTDAHQPGRVFSHISFFILTCYESEHTAAIAHVNTKRLFVADNNVHPVI